MHVPPEPADTLHEHALFAGSPVFGGVHELGGDLAPHAHDFVEVAVIGTGTGHHLTSRGELPLCAGNVVVLRPGAWHGFVGCLDLTVANCCVSAQALRGELAPLGEIPMFRRLLWTDPVSAGAHGVAVATVEATAAEEAIAEIARMERDFAGRGVRRGRVLGRLVTVLGLLADGRVGEPEPDSPIHPAVSAVVANLEASPAEPWRLDQLASSVNLDPAISAGCSGSTWA